MTHGDALIELFARTFGATPDAVRKLGADGSSRRYFRMTGSDGHSVVGGIGPDAAENRAFLSFSRSLQSIGLNVPEIYADDSSAGIWLEEDLGDLTLSAALTDARSRERGAFPPEIETLYERVLEHLPRFQVEGAHVVDFEMSYPRADFDEQSILWDLNAFKYQFLRLADVEFDEGLLEKDFRTLAGFLLRAETDYFMYRDFQARNIMLRGGEPWFIDYQGARRGALHYDVVSLLFSATTDIPPAPRDRLLEHYLTALSSHVEIDRAEWLEHYRGYILVRVLQALGTHGIRGYHERKTRFLGRIPVAARNLGTMLDEGLPVALPEMERVFHRIVDRWGQMDRPDTSTPQESAAETGLIVHLTSFSYKHGYPAQPDEHGGGFVFDCRAITNPGRDPLYVTMSGMDGGVVRYLEALPEVESFWQNARGLVEAQVDRYRERGFGSLSVSFGCTGGQHRSVYFAERIARHLTDRYPDVEVRIQHRERDRWPPRIEGSGAVVTPEKR